MNGRLDKVAMTNRLMQLKRELHYKCEIGEKGAKWECIGANEYLNKTLDVLDEYLAMNQFSVIIKLSNYNHGLYLSTVRDLISKKPNKNLQLKILLHQKANYG